MKRMVAWLIIWAVASFLVYAFGKPSELTIGGLLVSFAAVAVTFIVCRGIAWASEALEEEE